MANTYIDDNGYPRYRSDNSLVHRNVAYNQIYTPNRDKYPDRFGSYVVHHRDGNKKNYRAENLEIMKQSEHRRAHGGCFIATAAYGTPFAQEIDVLRNWRDDTLVSNMFGKLFVKTYYKLSPPIADFIRDKPFLRAITRVLLNPLINYLKIRTKTK